MTKKEQIIELLDKHGNETDLFKAFITKDEFSNLADDLVKLFAIPDVVWRSEQLKAFADYAQKRMWEDWDKDLSEFVDEFLRL
jgi:hypothetical protein